MLSRDIEKTADLMEKLIPRSPARDQIVALMNDLAADAHALESDNGALRGRAAPSDARTLFEPVDDSNVTRLFPRAAS